MEVVQGLNLTIGTNYVLNISVELLNIKTCHIQIKSEKKIFKNFPVNLDLKDNGSTTEKKIINIDLVPVSITDKPVWVEIFASEDSVIQASGFFVSIR